MTYKLLLDVAADGYSLKPGAETASVKLEGGASRFRKIAIGAAADVNVTWYTTAAQYAYLWAFYRARTLHGSAPFLLDIEFTVGQMQTCTVWFVPESLQLSGRNGDAFIVQAQLEVLPPAEDNAADLATIAAYEASVA